MFINRGVDEEDVDICILRSLVVLSAIFPETVEHVCVCVCVCVCVSVCLSVCLSVCVIMSYSLQPYGL